MSETIKEETAEAETRQAAQMLDLARAASTAVRAI